MSTQTILRSIDQGWPDGRPSLQHPYVPLTTSAMPMRELHTGLTAGEGRSRRARTMLLIITGLMLAALTLHDLPIASLLNAAAGATGAGILRQLALPEGWWAVAAALMLTGIWLARARHGAQPRLARADDVALLHDLAVVLQQQIETSKPDGQAALDAEIRAFIQAAALKLPASLFLTTAASLVSWLESPSRVAGSVEDHQQLRSLAGGAVFNLAAALG